MILLRRTVGQSMLPALRPGRLVWAVARPRRIGVGDIVIILHEGLEKIKRVQAIAGGRLYVLGDNAAQSTDSRHFGWLPQTSVIGRAFWPRR